MPVEPRTCRRTCCPEPPESRSSNRPPAPPMDRLTPFEGYPAGLPDGGGPPATAVGDLQPGPGLPRAVVQPDGGVEALAMFGLPTGVRSPPTGRAAPPKPWRTSGRPWHPRYPQWCWGITGPGLPSPARVGSLGRTATVEALCFLPERRLSAAPGLSVHVGPGLGGLAARRSRTSCRRSGLLWGISHRVSSHHEQPASAQRETSAIAASCSWLGVAPSAVTSNAGVTCGSSQARSARASSGPASRSPTSYWGTIPLQRSTRAIDFDRGHTPTTQIGMGCCTGVVDQDV